jgi:hypothetical protein
VDLVDGWSALCSTSTNLLKVSTSFSIGRLMAAVAGGSLPCVCWTWRTEPELLIYGSASYEFRVLICKRQRILEMNMPRRRRRRCRCCRRNRCCRRSEGAPTLWEHFHYMRVLQFWDYSYINVGVTLKVRPHTEKITSTIVSTPTLLEYSQTSVGVLQRCGRTHTR